MGRKKLSKTQQILLFDEDLEYKKVINQSIDVHIQSKKFKKNKFQQMNFLNIQKDNQMNIQGSKISFDFVHKVEIFFTENHLHLKNEKFILGISGGADSLAMLLAFFYLRNKYKLKLLVIHINYGLRGECSQNDKRVVQKICSDKNILIETKKIKNAPNNENKLRKIRFDIFRNIAQREKIPNICLAHNKEDQVETILLNIIRGCGINGLSGIKKVNILLNKTKIIHPMLNFKKTQIKKFLADQNTLWAEDKTNSLPIYSRNKIRLEMIPWIQKNMNNKAIENIFAMGNLLANNNLYWQNLAKVKMRKLLIKKGRQSEILCYPINKLQKENSILRYYLYKNIYLNLTKKHEDFYQYKFQQIENIQNSQGSKKLHLSENFFVIKEYDKLYFSNEDFTITPHLTEPMILPKINKVFVYDNYRIKINRVLSMPEKFDNSLEAYFDIEKISFPLILRHPLLGDRFRPVGMKKGSKKLKNFFIDEKVPKFERTNIIIFSDSQDIIWVGGLKIDQKALVNKNTKKILKISIEKLEKIRKAQRN